jgi:hypothetical protein
MHLMERGEKLDSHSLHPAIGVIPQTYTREHFEDMAVVHSRVWTDTLLCQTSDPSASGANTKEAI